MIEFNHNLETGRGYFGQIVTTHSYDERVATIRHAKELGLRTCVGGIFGMGESPAHRDELAMDLHALDVDEVPVNFLVSIDGTRLERVEPLQPLDMLRILACLRLALPRQNIFAAAGRQHLGQLQPLIFAAGASGMMIGDYLTTPNRSVQDDLDMLAQLGLKGHSCGTTAPRPEMMNRPGQSMKNEDVAPFTPYLNGNDHDIYGINNRFIENVGQYGVSYPDKPNMGKIKFGYEGFGIPVLFTSKGLIYLHRKISGPTLEEKEKEERRKNKKKKEEEIDELKVADCAISMEWVDANATC